MDDLLTKLTSLIVEIGKEHPGVGSFRLPNERGLAEALNVQRSTLRERLSTLEHLGVLRRTQGSGTYVEPLGSDVIRVYFDLALALGYIGIEDMGVARRLLEREIAGRAAEVCSVEEIEELAAICRRMESAKSEDERLKAEYEFHMNLALAARNPVITLIAEGLSSILRRVLARRRLLVRSIPDAGRRADAAHMPIVDALRARDSAAAMRAMDEHFRITDELWARESARFLVAAPEGFDPTELLKAQGGPLTNGGPSKKSKPSGSSRKTPSQPKDERAKR
jgi:GntR family transcriptional repressor for pyruvate dehydrogenase complex